jgi:hypothetical protein
MNFLGAAQDPIIEAMDQAKQSYDDADELQRGSPQPYRLIAALGEIATDEEVAETDIVNIKAFLTEMERQPEPAHWERYIIVCRSASTRDRAVLKLHVQLARKAMSSFPLFEESLRNALQARGWTPKDAMAPTSVSYKSVIKEVAKRRGWQS